MSIYLKLIFDRVVSGCKFIRFHGWTVVYSLNIDLNFVFKKPKVSNACYHKIFLKKTWDIFGKMHRFFPFYLWNSFYPSSFRRNDYAPCKVRKHIHLVSSEIEIACFEQSFGWVWTLSFCLIKFWYGLEQTAFDWIKSNPQVPQIFGNMPFINFFILFLNDYPYIPYCNQIDTWDPNTA